MIHDIFPHQFNNQYQNRKILDLDLVVLFDGQKVLLSCDGKLPTYQVVKHFDIDFQYACSLDGKAFFVTRKEQEPIQLDGYRYVAKQAFRQSLTSEDRAFWHTILSCWHIYKWYTMHQYCGHCGKELVHSSKERMLYCPHCKAMFYPTISPCVIVGVVNKDKILMSKYAGRAYGGYAFLAGFIEIGETPEQAICREVMEEVGLKVKNIRYYKSQPWSTDCNLLLGYYCELDGEDTIVLDQEELAMADWYSRDEIQIQDTGITLTYEMISYFKNHPEEF
ncbi:MAG: NAD(+) diphosphatase [Bacillota bacterium]|nr:NAD(+) diphosphatase [Bacillota bacterium]